MTCPKCKSTNVTVNTFQENQGSVTTSRTTSKYREKGHGCLWWLTIGWWWWVVDLCLWIFMFFPRLLFQLLRKKKYTGTSSTVSSTVNKLQYKTICTCQNCGHSWSKE